VEVGFGTAGEGAGAAEDEERREVRERRSGHCSEVERGML